MAPKRQTPPNFNNKRKDEQLCHCGKKKYAVPTYNKIPKVLRKLTADDESLLSIFEIDNGQRKYAKLGHRIKNGAFELRVRNETVLDRIKDVTNVERQRRLQEAYDYLLSSKKSSYSSYISYQLERGKKLKFWIVYKLCGIECAIWPILYPFTSWCESNLPSGSSILQSFKIKLLCNITSYNNNFELLQCHYDRWIYKTVTGAVSSGKYRHCSPLKSLENKNFTAGYWRWQQRYLADACLQFGTPKLFVTISPYEWEFPLASWILKYQQDSGTIPTKTGAVETLHIIHVLEQCLRGYFTGINTCTWESHDIKHLLYGQKHGKLNNVQCVFFRYEYQQRRTIHVHMLVWLRSFTDVAISRFSATIPRHDLDQAFFVHSLQSSDRPAPFLKVSATTSATESELHLMHTDDDKEVNLRAYVDTVLMSLRSRMDVQTSDGESALLRYVTSYVTKLSDQVELLNTLSSTSFQQAWPFLIDTFPGEPEMTMAFSGQKISQCNLTRVKIVPPTLEHFSEHSLFSKYVVREQEDESQSMVEWVRSHSVSKPEPTLLMKSNLAGVHYKYIFNPRFFFEFTICNTPFRSLVEIQDPRYNELPDNIRLFSYFYKNHKDIEKKQSFVNFLSYHGYNSNKIKSFQSLCTGYRTLYYKVNTISLLEKSMTNLPELHQEQSYVLKLLIAKLEERQQRSVSPASSCISLHSTCDISEQELTDDDQSSTDSNEDFSCSDNDTCAVPPLDKAESVPIKGILIKGKPGTGKSTLIDHFVDWCTTNSLRVLLACPTAYQARRWKMTHESKLITCDTVHSMFMIPINGSTPTVNWSLVKYDAVIIDEVGMISLRIMTHILYTVNSLPIPPIFLLCGDDAQQRPLDTIHGSTSSTGSIFNEPKLLSLVEQFTFYKQYRIKDTVLSDLLAVMRRSYVNKYQLELINSRCLVENENIDNEVIIAAFTENPETTFVTITKKGSRYINECICDTLFSKDSLLNIVLDSEMEKVELYEELSIMITQNINKQHGVVNGAEAYVAGFQNNLVFIRLVSGSYHFLYPLIDDETNQTYYPFIVNYSQTIFKVQGKNLKHITVWLDRKTATPGAAYVAFSRVEYFKNITLLQEVNRFQLCPIKNNRHYDVFFNEY